MRLNRLPVLVLAAVISVIAAGSVPSAALASHDQFSIISDGVHLAQNPDGTLQTFRKLGADTVRVIVPWAYIAPRPESAHRPSFNATDPGAYPAYKWTPWDNIIRDASKYGIQVDFTVTGGAPRWAWGHGAPHHIIGNSQRAWRPSASDFGKFVQALGKRYDGSYPDPQHPGSSLPAVHFWTIWNEPNFGEDLAPQATNGSSVDVAPMMYRNLVDAAWRGLERTGHSHDHILIGGLTAQGQRSGPTAGNHDGHPGDFAQMKPLEFIRQLYCLDNSFHELRGSIAKKEDCPTTRSASRKFRSEHPLLFAASGFGEHPYGHNVPPTKADGSDPDFVSVATLPREERTLDRATRTYGSGKHYSIYIDEYGYVTNPPNHGNFVSPNTAAYYLNWAEYLFWRSHRIGSDEQFLLYDPPSGPKYSQFDSGLLFHNGHHKATYDAYRLPLYMPHTSIGKGRKAEVWGCARPAPYAAKDTGSPQTAEIQFQRDSRGSFKTLKTVQITNSRGYFDVRMSFPASGTVRLTWSYPATDPFTPLDALGVAVHGRPIKITVR